MCRAAGSQNPYQGVCGHLEMVGWPLNVEACMERFFGMAEVPVVGEEKKTQGNFLFVRSACNWSTVLSWWVSHHRIRERQTGRDVEQSSSPIPLLD